MSLDCYCDYDPARVYRSSIVRARKAYKCEECAGRISAGEQHEYVFAIWDYGPTSMRTCGRCIDLRVWVRNNVPCLCWMHGDADQSLKDAVEDARGRAPEETRGLRFGLLRRFVLRNRHNKTTKALAA